MLLLLFHKNEIKNMNVINQARKGEKHLLQRTYYITVISTHQLLPRVRALIDGSSLLTCF